MIELTAHQVDESTNVMVRHNGSLKSLFLHGTIEEQEVVLNEASCRALIKQQEVIDLAESIDN